MSEPDAGLRGWRRWLGGTRPARRPSVGACVLVASFAAVWFGGISLALLERIGSAQARQPPQFCERPASGSPVPEPADLRSHDGVLRLDLAIHNSSKRYAAATGCFFDFV